MRGAGGCIREWGVYIGEGVWVYKGGGGCIRQKGG